MRKNYVVWAIATAMALPILQSNAQAPVHGSILHMFQDDEDEEEEDQEPYKGVSFGLNLGSYFGSKTTANYYNGDGTNDFQQANGVRCLSIAERLDPTVFVNDMRYINTYYNSSSVEIPYDSYPINMRYNPTLMVGLQIKYGISRTSSFIFNLNALKLKAVDRFTLRFIGTPLQQNSQQDVRLFQIIGNEQRFNMNLGYRQGFEMGPNANFYFQFGGSMLGTKVMSNQILVADKKYDLFMYTSNVNTPVAYQARAGVGFGFYIAPGIEFFMANKHSFDISFVMSRDRMVLNNYKQGGWNKMLMASFSL